MSHTGEVCPQSGIYSNDCHAKQIALSVGERFPGPPPAGPSLGDQPTSPAPASWSPWTCCPGWTSVAKTCATLRSRIWTSGSPVAPPPAGPCVTSSSGHMAAAWPAI
jgi:hypothetical protein